MGAGEEERPRVGGSMLLSVTHGIVYNSFSWVEVHSIQGRRRNELRSRPCQESQILPTAWKATARAVTVTSGQRSVFSFLLVFSIYTNKSLTNFSWNSRHSVIKHRERYLGIPLLPPNSLCLVELKANFLWNIRLLWLRLSSSVILIYMLIRSHHF